VLNINYVTDNHTTFTNNSKSVLLKHIIHNNVKSDIVLEWNVACYCTTHGREGAINHTIPPTKQIYIAKYLR
jgi:hypothetical protein